MINSISLTKMKMEPEVTIETPIETAPAETVVEVEPVINTEA
jgi:hypothetical protein